MKLKLTEQSILKIKVPEGKRDVLVFDDALPGFGVRKFKSGKTNFFVKYSIKKQQRKITLSPVVPGVLADMRRKAAEVLAKVRLGQDVQGERLAVMAQQEKGLRLSRAIELYLADRKPAMKPRYYLEVKRQLEGDWLPLHSMAVQDIHRRDVVAVVDVIAARGRVAADRARSALGTLYIWLIDRGYVDDTPVRHIKPRSQTNGGRDRTLSEGELRAIWRACEAGSDYNRIVRLLMLMGQRRDEIGSLRWSEVNLAESQIELPAERTKNGRAHIIPLGSLALDQLPIRSEPRQHVFGRSPNSGFSGWSKAKRELDAALGDEVAPWRLHDLRRTFVTMINERGFALPHVIEAIVNHVSGHRGGVAGVYNRAEYSHEKRAALLKWSEHIESIVK